MNKTDEVLNFRFFTSASASGYRIEYNGTVILEWTMREGYNKSDEQLRRLQRGCTAWHKPSEQMNLQVGAHLWLTYSEEERHLITLPLAMKAFERSSRYRLTSLRARGAVS